MDRLRCLWPTVWRKSLNLDWLLSAIRCPNGIDDLYSDQAFPPRWLRTNIIDDALAKVSDLGGDLITMLKIPYSIFLTDIDGLSEVTMPGKRRVHRKDAFRANDPVFRDFCRAKSTNKGRQAIVRKSECGTDRF